MTNIYRALVAVLFFGTASGFGIHDSFHLMQTAASSASHQVPHFDLLTAYKSQLISNPLPTKCLTGATLAVAGDAIAQSQAKDESYDQRRAASFAVFDMAYRALQHFSFPIIVANCHGQFLDSSPLLHGNIDLSNLAAMEQTLASQLGIVPFMYYPGKAEKNLLATTDVNKLLDSQSPSCSPLFFFGTNNSLLCFNWRNTRSIYGRRSD